MILLTNERLKEIEQEEYKRLNISKSIDAWGTVSGIFDIDENYDNSEIRGFVFGKIMSVFDECFTTNSRTINSNGHMYYDLEVIKKLLAEIDPYIEYGSLSFRDLNSVQHEIVFFKYGCDSRWEYRESLILFGDRKFLFENE